mmetsp:Transcript_6593/g.14595  ORF Transcript_6593/g.14595 Transcript_6593/m.14595 type:complete len:81 (+) Transcript_6593:84-326(+)
MICCWSDEPKMSVRGLRIHDVFTAVEPMNCGNFNRWWILHQLRKTYLIHKKRLSNTIISSSSFVQTFTTNYAETHPGEPC